MTRLNPDDTSSVREEIFTLGPVHLNYAELLGRGSPLLLLHGLARNWRDVLPLIPGLEQRHHVFAVDLLGHGKSARAPGAYNISAYASDVIGFLEQILDGPVVIFGHSLGGMVGMYIALHQPSRVQALVLGDTMLARDAFDRSMYFSFFRTLHALLLQRTSVPDLARRLAEAEILVPGLEYPVAIGDLPGNDGAVLLKWAECLDQVDPQAIAMTLSGTAYAEFEPDKWLAQIHCPTLILQANPDLGGLISEADLHSALHLLPHAAHKFFPLLGHALHLQNPAAVLDAVTSYLSSIKVNS